MPLIKGKSPKAFKKNIETEMASGKPQDQALAIAYSVKRKSKKKMAKGGHIDESTGIHTPNYNEGKGKKGISESGEAYRISKTNSNVSNPTKEGLRKAAIQEHRNKLEEMRSMPKPKLAAGGMITSTQGPKMVESSRIKAKSREEADREMMLPIKKEQYADGDEIHVDINSHKNEPNDDEMMAEGGEIDDSPDHEMEEEHHNSIAAAIMAKRHREAQDSDSDIDTQMMMAEGGDVESDVVDLMENGEEQPNEFYHLNEDEALEHNFNAPLEDIHQPEDSNLMGDPAEDEAENEHDMISSIRRKMSMRRQFGKK